LPLVACVLLLFLCAAAIGTTCAVCVSSHPVQALEHSLGSAPTAAPPPPVVDWGLVLVLAFAPALVVRRRPRSSGRASPAVLQRFLF
jgi:MYXO-CTERM domain-containing protein